jgi:hypothetical protein
MQMRIWLTQLFLSLRNGELCTKDGFALSVAQRYRQERGQGAAKKWRLRLPASKSIVLDYVRDIGNNVG